MKNLKDILTESMNDIEKVTKLAKELIKLLDKFNYELLEVPDSKTQMLALIDNSDNRTEIIRRQEFDMYSSFVPEEPSIDDETLNNCEALNKILVKLQKYGWYISCNEDGPTITDGDNEMPLFEI